MAADEDLVAIRPDELTEFVTPEADALLDLLILKGRGAPEDHHWSFDVDEWEGEDEAFRFEEGQIRRYVHVNGQRVQFLETDESPVAVMSDIDVLVGEEQIGELVWNNGGDPASGYLYSVRPRVAVGLERRDIEQKIRGFRHGTDARAQAQMLYRWLLFADGFGTGGGAAAVALEPFDPNGTLTPQRRAKWDDVLGEQRDGWEYTFRVAFDVPDGVKAELRTRLAAADSGYVRVRDALANPIEGDWLRDQLAVGQTESLW